MLPFAGLSALLNSNVVSVVSWDVVFFTELGLQPFSASGFMSINSNMIQKEEQVNFACSKIFELYRGNTVLKLVKWLTIGKELFGTRCNVM